jgi:membrane-bound serine protease (ClpP class)
VLLVLEIFLPSHGIFATLGLGSLAGGIYMAFQHGQATGAVSVVVAIIVVPSIFFMGIRVFRRTAIGRRVVPPNPILTAADVGVDVSSIEPLVGQTGRTISPLRPVGYAEFSGRRVQCVAESGIIEAGVEIRGVGILGGSLSVRPLSMEPPRS